MGFLVDMGAAHNFIDPLIVSRLGLRLTEVNGFEMDLRWKWQMVRK